MRKYESEVGSDKAKFKSGDRVEIDVSAAPKHYRKNSVHKLGTVTACGDRNVAVRRDGGK